MAKSVMKKSPVIIWPLQRFLLLLSWLLSAWRSVCLSISGAFLSVLGLSFGISCCILMLLFAKYEFSYDSDYAGSDRTYRLDRAQEEGVISNNLLHSFTPELFAPLSPETGSGDIEVYGRYEPFMVRNIIIRSQQRLSEEECLLVDKGFFQLLDFPIIENGVFQEFSDPGTVVITKSIARKYFGSRPVLGNTLILQDNKLLKVVGVVNDFPDNSHIKQRIFVNSSTYQNIAGLEWDLSSILSAALVRLSETADPESVIAQLNRSYRFLHGDDENPRFRLTPISDIHLDAPAINLMVSGSGNSWSVTNRVFTVIGIILALMILTTAIINFVNINVAKASQRSREIGVRKVLGASRAQLLGQYLSEAMLLTVLAALLALLLVWALLPWFNMIVDRPLALTELSGVKDWIIFLSMTFIIGILAGFYPALVLSRLSPIAAIRGGNSVASTGNLRKVLVINQFAVATLLVAAALMAYQQLDLFRDQDMGFDKDMYLLKPNLDSLITFNRNNKESHGDYSNPLYKVSLRIQKELLQQSAISNVAVSGFAPGYNFPDSLEASRSDDGEQPYVSIGYVGSIDEHFIELYDIPFLAGRNFSMAQSSDVEPEFDQKNWNASKEGGAIILTETTVKLLGFRSPEEAIGQTVFSRMPLFDYEVKRQEKLGVQVPRPSTSNHVVGVVKDMQLGDGILGIQAAGFTFNPRGGSSLSVKAQPGQGKAAMEQIRNTLKQTAPDLLFDLQYLPETLERSLLPFNRLLLAFIGFAILAIGISCLGLYAMAKFTVARRTKEVGIRKVLGASSGRLVWLLGWDFTKPVVVAMALSLPLAYISCNYMLQAFVQKVPIGFELLGGAAMLITGISWLTVGSQTWIAANANPSESLRSE